MISQSTPFTDAVIIHPVNELAFMTFMTFYTDALLVSDGLACFIAVADLVSGHERVVVGVRKSSDLDCFHRVNTLLGNIKSSIQGSYHEFKFDKYAARYLAELQYRFNRRYDLPSMVPRLLRACTLTTARPENWLRSAEGWG